MFQNVNGQGSGNIGSHLILDTLKFTAQLGWAKTNTNFFYALVEYLCKTFSLRYAFVDQIDSGENPVARTVAVYGNGEILDNFEYELKHTPCENVHGKILCCYENNVQTLFPKDQLLVDLEVEGYVGVPLWNAAGEAIGLIGVMDDKIITNLGEIQMVLQLVAVRAAHELDQMIISQELEDTLNYNKTIINKSNEGIIGYDKELKYTEWNKFMEELTSTSAEQVIGQLAREVFPSIIENGIYEKLQKTLVEENNNHLEFMYRNPRSHREYWLRYSCSPLYNSYGAFIGIIATVVDVTSYKINEVELVKAKDLAEESNEAKTRFLANMSHEIRTPLNGIMGVLQLIATSDLDHDQTELMEAALNSSDALLHVINDILDHTKITGTSFTLENISFDPNSVLHDVKHLFKLSAEEKGLDFVFTSSIDVSSQMIGDPFRLRQILSNLIGNAIKFTSSGYVTVDAKIVDHPSDSALTIKFSVKDSGIGIGKVKQREIFDSFMQADTSITRKFGGSGLGLSICKGLVEKMGGTIHVNSEPGVGSEFVFTCQFGLHTEKGEDQQTLKINNELDGDHLTILIAEDDPVNQLIIKKFVEMKGWKPILSNNGVQALSLFNQSDFDVVLMDIQMPQKDGIETTLEIRSSEANTNNQVPIIAMTAHALDGDRLMCLEAGMDDYISKPILAEELYEKIFKLI